MLPQGSMSDAASSFHLARGAPRGAAGAARRVLRRSVAAGRPRGGHARPFRSCPARPRDGARHARDPRHHAGPPRRWRRGRVRKPLAYGETVEHRRGRRCRWCRRAMSSARPRWCMEYAGSACRRLRRLQAPPRPDLPRRSSRSPATCSSPRRPSGCRCSAIRRPATRSPGCCDSVRAVPGALPPDRRLCAGQGAAADRAAARRRLRRPIYLHGALQRLCELYEPHGVELGPLRPATGETPARSAGRDRIAPPARSPIAGRGACPTRWSASPRAGCASSSARPQRGVELPLVISDHADWDELRHHRRVRRRESGSRTAARRRWCTAPAQHGVRGQGAGAGRLRGGGAERRPEDRPRLAGQIDLPPGLVELAPPEHASRSEPQE